MRQKSMQFPKYGKSRFLQYEKSMGKHRHFKFMGWGEAKIQTIPKTWEEWILIIRERYEEKTFQSYGFLKYFVWSKNPHVPLNVDHCSLLFRKSWINFEQRLLDDDEPGYKTDHQIYLKQSVFLWKYICAL